MKPWDELYKDIQRNVLNIANDLKQLSNDIDTRGLTLCIGAGVTASLVGSWTYLLNELAVMRCCDEQMWDNPFAPIADIGKMREFINRNERGKEGSFIPNSTNVLEQGEYLLYDSCDGIAKKLEENGQTGREQFWREEFFAAQTESVISKKIKEKLGNKTIVEHFLNWKANPSISPDIGTLAAVVELCVKKNVNEIITYNFDTLLDQLLCSEDVWNSFAKKNEQKNIEVYTYPDGHKEREHIISSDERKTIRIYHVHGVLDESFGTNIVFSENSYLEYQDRALNWSNVKIADTMFHSTMLCVGFSGTDPNFRYLCRLLKANASLARIDGSEDNSGIINDVYLIRVYNTDGKSDVGRFIPRKLDASGKETKEPDFPSEPTEIACTYYCVKTYLKVVRDYYFHQLGTKILWAEKYQDAANLILDLSNK